VSRVAGAEGFVPVAAIVVLGAAVFGLAAGFTAGGFFEIEIAESVRSLGLLSVFTSRAGASAFDGGSGVTLV
jgi:hypothetical protein